MRAPPSVISSTPQSDSVDPRCRGQRAFCGPVLLGTSSASDRGVQETKFNTPSSENRPRWENTSGRLRQADHPTAETFLVREIGNGRLSADRDEAPSCENLRGAEAGAARSIPLGDRSHNRLGARSSVHHQELRLRAKFSHDSRKCAQLSIS